MPRGRQYYDPIIQTGASVEGDKDLSRIEMYMDEEYRWWARRIAPDGSLTGETRHGTQRDDVLALAQAAWPDLTVYELRNESDDSTWEGTGPTPRLWQDGRTHHDAAVAPVVPLPVHTPETAVEADPVEVRAFSVEAGTYMHVDDIRRLLNSYANVYDESDNPSASKALRAAADMLGGE